MFKNLAMLKERSDNKMPASPGKRGAAAAAAGGQGGEAGKAAKRSRQAAVKGSPFSFAKQAKCYDPRSTATMEGDVARMDFYEASLEAAGLAGKTVLDLGTGDHG